MLGAESIKVTDLLCVCETFDFKYHLKKRLKTKQNRKNTSLELWHVQYMILNNNPDKIILLESTVYRFKSTI